MVRGRCAARPRSGVRVQAIFGKLFRSDPAEKTRKTYQTRVDSINALESKVQGLSDDQLREKTQEFKARVAKGESLEALLPEAFAVSNCVRVCMHACVHGGQNARMG